MWDPAAQSLIKMFVFVVLPPYKALFLEALLISPTPPGTPKFISSPRFAGTSFGESNNSNNNNKRGKARRQQELYRIATGRCEVAPSLLPVGHGGPHTPTQTRARCFYTAHPPPRRSLCKNPLACPTIVLTLSAAAGAPSLLPSPARPLPRAQPQLLPHRPGAMAAVRPCRASWPPECGAPPARLPGLAPPTPGPRLAPQLLPRSAPRAPAAAAAPLSRSPSRSLPPSAGPPRVVACAPSPPGVTAPAADFLPPGPTGARAPRARRGPEARTARRPERARLPGSAWRAFASSVVPRAPSAAAQKGPGTPTAHPGGGALGRACAMRTPFSPI
jgi:hypothetical protein